jgi:hypothetical protein
LADLNSPENYNSIKIIIVQPRWGLLRGVCCLPQAAPVVIVVAALWAFGIKFATNIFLE